MVTPSILEGVKVLDFSWMYAGPHATKHLAALGADVVKVESKVKPDPMRHGFTYDQFDSRENLNVSAYYNEFNLGKRSLRLNLTSDEGRELALELAQKADVWIENFSPQFLAKIGLDYESVRKVNEDIIYVSMPGWAKSGPAKNYRAWGMNLESMAGLDYISGFPDDPPTPAGFSWPDPTSGITATIAICSALLGREHKSSGNYIEVPQFETTVTFLHKEVMQAMITGKVSKRIGNRDSDGRYVQGVYPCEGEDNWVAIAIETDQQWKSFCDVVERSDRNSDLQFPSHKEPHNNHETIDELIPEWTRNHSAEKVRELLQEANIPAGVVVDERDLMEHDTQLRTREFFSRFDHPDIGEQRYPGVPFQIDGEVVEFPSRSPRFGEHTTEVLYDWLDANASRVDLLEANDVLY